MQAKQLQRDAQARLNEMADHLRNLPSADLSAKVRAGVCSPRRVVAMALLLVSYRIAGPQALRAALARAAGIRSVAGSSLRDSPVGPQ